MTMGIGGNRLGEAIAWLRAMVGKGLTVEQIASELTRRFGADTAKTILSAAGVPASRVADGMTQPGAEPAPLLEGGPLEPPDFPGAPGDIEELPGRGPGGRRPPEPDSEHLPGSPPASVNPPSRPSPAPGAPGTPEKPVVRPWSALVGKPLSEFTDAEAEYYFGGATMGGQGAAVRDILEGPLGMKLGAGNPFSDFLESRAPGLWQALEVKSLLGGNPMTTRERVDAMGRSLTGAGELTPFKSVGDVDQFMRGMLGILPGGTGFSSDPAARLLQGSFGHELATNPERAMGFFTDMLSGVVSPTLMGSKAAMGRYFDDLMTSYRRSAPSDPAGSFFKYMVGGR